MTTHDGAFWSLAIGIRVWENGRMEYTGLVRMPYSNRPKKGGGIAVPYGALNFPDPDFPRNRRFLLTQKRVATAISKGKAYNPPVHMGIQPERARMKHT